MACKGPKWSCAFHVFHWYKALALVHVLTDQTLTHVLSSPPTGLCDSLYGRSILAFDGCYRQAVWENGNPVSSTGMLQSLEVDLWNGDVFGTPQEWCQTGWGGFPRRPTADITLLAWLESDVTELEEVSVYVRMHIRACLHSLGCDSCLISPIKIKLQCVVWGARLYFVWLRQFPTTLVWNPILCCPLFN